MKPSALSRSNRTHEFYALVKTRHFALAERFCIANSRLAVNRYDLTFRFDLNIYPVQTSTMITNSDSLDWREQGA